MYTSVEDKRRFQRNWMRARRKAWFDTNGPCAGCGTWANLELDHIDPATKINSQIWSWTAVRREQELAKCQALCDSCHRTKSIGERLIANPIQHGTHAAYTRRGCRCSDCRWAVALYMREYRKRK